MSHTVFADGMAVCHSNSPGKAIGFPDVCLSPPPPPAGPLPIPYPNTAMASDLASGSQSVAADGGAIALEDTSYISTSTGDEAGTQGGNVVSHKTKGKAYFQMYSMDVLVEGKHVGRHGDVMGMNCGSPVGGIHPMFLDTANLALAEDSDAKCDKPYDREKLPHGGSPSAAQRRMVKGKPCWQCGKSETPMIADHQPPLVVTYHDGGCKDDTKMKDAVETTNNDPKKGPAILPHCSDCSQNQRNSMSEFSRRMNAKLG